MCVEQQTFMKTEKCNLRGKSIFLVLLLCWHSIWNISVVQYCDLLTVRPHLDGNRSLVWWWWKGKSRGDFDKCVAIKSLKIFTKRLLKSGIIEKVKFTHQIQCRFSARPYTICTGRITWQWAMKERCYITEGASQGHGSDQGYASLTDNPKHPIGFSIMHRHTQDAMGQDFTPPQMVQQTMYLWR